ncbi:MAG: class I SAM-dependent methyltransferase [Bdellovibrionaceae bacterium]|nr:class I SAM-dependent methyltransferase [Pseudobdellovibrionaceae bacterium]
MEKISDSPFGYEVPPLLSNHCDLFKGGRAIDVGCANGTATKWLRAKGYDAIGIDNHLYEDQLPKYIFKADIRTFELNRFDLILALNVLQFLKFSEKKSVFAKFLDGLLPGGLLIIESFTTQDETYNRFRRDNEEEVEPNTFWSPRRNAYASFFALGELRDWAKQANLLEIFYNEEIIQDNHPPVGVHNHGIVSAVFKKL